jgi:hypothetical protein
MNRASLIAVKHYITTAVPEELDELKRVIVARERELEEGQKKMRSLGFCIIQESTKSNMG